LLLDEIREPVEERIKIWVNEEDQNALLNLQYYFRR
jgi:hypothetical protein